MYEWYKELQDYFPFSTELLTYLSRDLYVYTCCVINFYRDYLHNIHVCSKVYNYSSMSTTRDKFISFVQCATFRSANYNEFL